MGYVAFDTIYAPKTACVKLTMPKKRDKGIENSLCLKKKDKGIEKMHIYNALEKLWWNRYYYS